VLTNFFDQGSVAAVLLMAFASHVMLDAALQDRKDPRGLNTPPIIKSTLGTLLVIGSFPCLFWPAIYVGLFDGFWAAVSVWIILQALFGLFVRLNPRLLGTNFVLASLAYPIGYYLSFVNLP
jgi:hypothetical protein